MKKRRLITSALPYVNNIPHLGNLIQVLSADVFARYCRLAGYETLYICGTDEYGTATETKAREEGITPKELCTRYYTIHKDIYDWFNISFDKFGRTSTDEQTEIVQSIFLKLYENGYINEQEIEQLYSEESDMFLADRYVRGTCPHCGYTEARGDQCENCGKVLDPSDLVDPRSALDNSRPVMRKTRHLYINLPAILPKLEAWMKEASVSGRWAHNALQMTHSWIRDGLKERSITRDLKWGIPVPLEAFAGKVFYVWFDAPIGYISITATHTSDWESWWRNPDNVELFQFIGKDNIPFHTVIFPSSLLGTHEQWTMLHHMSSTEYLNYESGKFSKSMGIGVFGNDAQETGIPADVWRFYMFYNRPETSDAVFTWDDFQEKTNGELIGNLSNLVNRTLTFVSRYYEGSMPQGAGSNPTFWAEVAEREAKITEFFEWAQLRSAFRAVFALSSLGNRHFQAGEPWKTRETDPDATAALLADLVYLVRDIAILIEPFLPETARRIAVFLGIEELTWSMLGTSEGITAVGRPEVLFRKLEDGQIKDLRERFSGSQADRAAAAKMDETFASSVRLVAARITDVKRHEKADKLFVEQIDDGSGAERQIVSGLVGFYEPEELVGKTVIVVDNLKPAKLRGELSQGMLLAAENEDRSIVEVLFLNDVEPGTQILLEGIDRTLEDPPVIDVDTFFSIPIEARQSVVRVADRPLTANGRQITTERVADGSVG
ncbi:MAG: methionine--tRNA ligase [Spirochaetaceae bacterium]|nr:MAG: methionine--tRNA ligase [Spirochaetaceae bacterium]